MVVDIVVSFTRWPVGSALSSCRGQQAGLACVPNWRCVRELGLRLDEPRVEFLWRYRAHNDRHAAMVRAADLVALAVEHAWLVHPEPRFDGPPRNGIALHAECRHEPAVDDIGAGLQHADVL